MRAKRFLISACVAICAVALDPQSFIEAQSSTPVEFGRLSFQLPGNWRKASETENVVTYAAPEDMAALQVVEPSGLRTWTIEGFLSNGIQGMERGAEVLRSFPEQPRSGRTRSGVGFAFQSRVTRDSSGVVTYAGYYAFSTGARFQALILTTRDREAFGQHIRSVSGAIDSIQTSPLPASRAPALRSPVGSQSFFNYGLNHPANWEPDESPYANLIVYRVPQLVGGGLVVGRSNSFVTSYELQPHTPVSPVAALESFLLHRAQVPYGSSYDADSSPRLEDIIEGRLPNGLEYVGVRYEQNKDDRWYFGGLLIKGEGSSLLIGTGLRYFRYDMIKRGSTLTADHNAWLAHFEHLKAIANSVRFEDSHISRKQSLEDWLMRKRTFRYHNERTSISGDVSFYSSKRAAWDFLPERRVEYDIESFSAFNIYETTPTGQPDTSSGFMDAEGEARQSHFTVWSDGRTDFIVVMRPSGLATFHPVQTSPEFRIDGFLDGCCR